MLRFCGALSELESDKSELWTKSRIMVGRRKSVGAVGALANDAAEVDQHQFATAPPDLEPERIRAFGIERHRDGRLPNAAAQRRLPLQQPSACSRFMIAEVDCTESPVSRATSILDSGPKRRTSDSSSRSL